MLPEPQQPTTINLHRDALATAMTFANLANQSHWSPERQQRLDNISEEWRSIALSLKT